MKTKWSRWSDKEISLLRNVNMDYGQLQSILSYRTKRAIKKKCQNLGIRRSKSACKLGRIYAILSRYECELLLDDSQFVQMVDGSLLGDACICKGNSLAFSFCTADREYLEYLSGYFGSKLKSEAKIHYCPPVDSVVVTKYGEQTIHGSGSYFLAYSRFAIFNNFYQRWYDDGIKHIPRDLELSPLLCRCWYIDDGTIRSSGSIQIALHTDGFMGEDVNWLSQQLNSKLEIDSKVRPAGKRKDGNIRYVIRLFGRDIIVFLDYIGECPVSSYEYKWNLRGYGKIDFKCKYCELPVECYGFNSVKRERKTCGSVECVTQLRKELRIARRQKLTD